MTSSPHNADLPAAWGGDKLADGLPKNPARRKFLTYATSAVGGVGIAAATIPFVRSWTPSAKARAIGGPVKADISKLAVSELMIVEWRGQPVFIIRMSDAMMASLGHDQDRLADPMSAYSQQPEYVQERTRSVRPDIQVLVGFCTHLGCSPKYYPDAKPQPFDASWHGGYFCPCHGSKFDLAGRVYSGVPAPTNMVVPPHRYLDNNTLFIGEDPPA